jgi:hypothetical protein
VTVPPAARANTPAGAEAFARFYLELVNRAWSEPNPDLLRPYVLPTCKTCTRDLQTAEELRRLGHRYAGPAAALGPSVVTPASVPDRRTVQVVLKQLRQVIRDRHGKVVERVPAEKAVLEVTLRRQRSTEWRIATIKVVQL